MKKPIIVMACLAITCSATHAQKTAKTPAAKPAASKAMPSPFKNANDSFSYAIGLNVAMNLKQQSVDNINTALMSKAMNDVFGGKKAQLDDQQSNQIIQQILRGNQAKKIDAEKTRCLSFLEANKKRKEVIVTKTGLQYEVIKKGDPNGPTPTAQDTVVAHYKGTLLDGKQFDNSYERGAPLTIPVAGVIPGWTEVLQLMHVGDKFKVYIPSNLGYGDQGAGPDIPGGATLVFEMELLEVKKASTEKPAGVSETSN